MSTVRETFGLACPKCGRDDHLIVEVTTMVRLYPEGTESVGDEEWGPDSNCACTTCDFRDRVEVLMVPYGDEVLP